MTPHAGTHTAGKPQPDVAGPVVRGMRWLTRARWQRVLSTALSLLMLLGIFGGAAPSHAAQSPQERWVVLDPTLTEIVVALDQTDLLVGTVGGVDHLPLPDGVARLEGYRIVAAEPLLALAPSVVLIGADRVLPATISQLQSAGVEVVHLGADPSVAAFHTRVMALARRFAREAQATVLLREFDAALTTASTRAHSLGPAPRAIFVLAGGARPTVAAGRDTYPDLLLSLSAARNIAQSVDGFKVLSQEVMIAAAPEVIVTIEEGLVADRSGQPAVLKAPGIRLTPAARDQRVIALPGRFLQGMGLSTPEAIRHLARVLREPAP